MLGGDVVDTLPDGRCEHDDRRRSARYDRRNDDAGIRALPAMHALRRLKLRDVSTVTDEALQGFRDRNPRCAIVR